MKEYLRIRQTREKRSRRNGILLTVCLHLGLCCVLVYSGLKYIYPPPPETSSFVIEFENEPENEVRASLKGEEAEAEIVDKSKPVTLVQQSQAMNTGKKANEGKASTVDDFGDVDIPKPKNEKPIDNRALFHAADNQSDKDTLAAQTARKVSDALNAGHPDGNIKSGNVSGTPTAHLKGRRVVSESLQKPTYNVQDEGTVVVRIWVDKYGKVQKAVAGDAGTTTSNSSLWCEARKVALKARFKEDLSAPDLQEGTITYIFKLK